MHSVPQYMTVTNLNPPIPLCTSCGQAQVQPCAARQQTACTNILEKTSASIFREEETFFNKLHDVSIQKAVLLKMLSHKPQISNSRSIIDTIKTCCCQLQQAA